MKPTIFSGVQPTGTPTLGNFIGAMKGFVELQYDYDATYCVVNQHALTVPKDPVRLKEQTLQMAALYLALGIDPNVATIFVQSDIPAHAQAAWLILCQTGLGELERMTQFKDKAAKQESVGAGLLCYPPLMVADIVLHDTQFVPVGDDQRQHIELTRNFVDRFNARYGENLLVKPEAIFPKAGGRVKSLQDPLSKMSKSDTNEKSYILLLDDPKVITKKIKGAVTDSLGVVQYDVENQPGVANLLHIFSSLSGRSIDDLVNDYGSTGYGRFKTDLAELVTDTLAPIQARYEKLLVSDDLHDILAAGAQKASVRANATLARMEKAIGVGY
ncbi:tryptophan--tRNA ligase [Aerococcaceae bacterium zg-ZJ1578]|uniref:tryptophan--tRNA ligase n=1 Tax=Aerococcaceae TaxID=186827 RepID=UPI0013BDCD58|nr:MULTISPECIES: tryptophan--tRNA ligase [unclassified Facklamia]MBK0347782.1 tryptophan--tRNA ligase [Aerococcaceae bacterium zg-1578]MBR7927428.1 tryptophan--tRNA ligase [Aerococcaceae bacterium zg-ZUI334]MBS4461367.1 tryptophan--tRNA ligase [Aerococcaceae bacterium zg-B36]QQD65864.1 tryptophan--tRNA ligase [Aerococcaceae bacterium zg-252]NEW64159.1 tryptophan--tRNA ligase [Facklamia sp. 252]